jgi:hypothetical protein
MYRIIAIILASILSFSVFSKDVYEKNGNPLAQEYLRVQTTSGGSMVWIRDLGISPTMSVYVDFTFKIRPDAAEDNHIAIGIGQLYEGLEQSDAGLPIVDGPLGEGFVIGRFNEMPLPNEGCPSPTINLTFESYYSGTVLDSASCIQLEKNKVYRIFYVVTKDYKVNYKLYNEAGDLIKFAERSWKGVLKPHRKGFFLIPVFGEPKYDLINLQVGSLPSPKPKNK